MICLTTLFISLGYKVLNDVKLVVNEMERL